ncbi:MAG TPA: galactokinase [Bellilinea sp.]|nr:galactokinase [Bellilinea sp.]
MDLISTVSQRFEEEFGRIPVDIVRSPGRVNLLGEHVDYNAGFVMPAAIDRASYLAFAPAQGGVSTLAALDMDERVSFTLDSVNQHQDVNGQPLPHWALYPAGVCWALAQAGYAVPALQAAFTSNIPQGSGLSSSASIELGFISAWQAIGGWTLPPMQRALLGQKGENQYVGVNCGIMDQFACACGETDRLLLLDCRSLEWRTLPLPAELAIVVADTTIRRKLTSGAYNERRADCEEAVRLLQADLPQISSLRDVAVNEFNRLAGKLPERVQKRARHIVEEIARSEKAIALLESGDIAAFGKLLNECHTSLRDLYEVSIPELDIMVEIAQRLPGVWGARLTGAGFGGCTVNLVEKTAVADFVSALEQGYTARTNLKPEIYVCSASTGTAII